ncbi:MAG: permease-like cell division protein FtsX [Bacilli bacterium]
MRIRTIGRHGREGFKNLFRNGWMTFAAVSAVAVTLLILGASLVLSVNVQAMSANIENQLQFNAYVSDSVSQKELPKLGGEIHAIAGVRSVTFVSKEQALKKMKQLLQANADLINGLGNPLPNEFVIQVVDPHRIPAIARKIGTLPGIAKVEYGGSIIPKLLSIVTIVRDTAIVFIAGLVIMGMFLISNTIKITIFTRRREIEIMKLVGATDGFIRGPFFVEGTLMGLLGALVPSIVLYEGYRWLAKSVTLFPPFSLLPTPYVMDRVVLVLFGCGLFIGLWGSVVSMRKFLRV